MFSDDAVVACRACPGRLQSGAHLYRVSRVMSELGCDVDLVLIATEGRRAIDVFHLTRSGQKLTPSQQEEMTENLQRVLEGRS